MAALVLAGVGSAIGASIGGTILGIGMATIGQTLGGLVGGFIDSKLFGGGGSAGDGPTLTDLRVTSSTEGTPLQRVYGRARVAGQVIWATYLEEVVSEEEPAGGGKGGMGGGGGGKQKIYRYYVSFAVSLCEGQISSVGRVWADGKELELTDYVYRTYLGTLTQAPDPHMEAKQGSGTVPAYRGTAYIVFERMPLEKFGNRLPNLNFEIFRGLDSFETSLKALTIIPASGEFCYSTVEVKRIVGFVTRVSENKNTKRVGVDFIVSMEDMVNSFPNVQNCALVVSWFGTDLRCGTCQVIPKTENINKSTEGMEWTVAGYTRATAEQTSRYYYGPLATQGTRAAYGGTPADESVRQGIAHLHALGRQVTFYPFLMMDIEAANTLPDPYRAAGSDVGQGAYPWRGRITLSKAPGVAGTPDKTASATSEVSAFVAQWRTFILHYANLCASVGGVDTFYIGTEMRGLTQIRDSAGNFPFVNALVTLAADVKAILPGAKITYGADWSEYFGYQPGDGSGDVYFHLDPLWSSPNVAAIAIDCYWPLADWRKGAAHLDRLAGHRSIYDMNYLKGNVRGGEGFDWYYPSQSARDLQARVPITDGLGKPWVFKYKDVKSWWMNQHYNRPGGAESSSPTAWVPQSKPIWFSEIGCPAVDFGANQPNVFIDPKSIESFYPYYSSGARDDYMMRRFLQAFTEFWDTTHEDYITGSNPVSTIYGAAMVDISRIYIYTWDARPYPAFPHQKQIWQDGANWTTGHWLSGRIGGGGGGGRPLDTLVRAVLEDYGFTAFDVTGLSGQIDGFIVDRIMSVRDAISPLESAYFFDTFESGSFIKFRHRGYFGSQITLTQDALVDGDGGGDSTENRLYEITRGQETDLPLAAKLTYYDGASDYKQASVEARRLTVRSDRISTAQFPIVSQQAQMQSIAEILLHENWVAREKAKFSVPPSMMFLEPTDVVTLDVGGGRTFKFRIMGIQDGGQRALSLTQIDSSLYEHVRGADRVGKETVIVTYGSPATFYMDLPVFRIGDDAEAGYIGSYLDPWPGTISVYRSPITTGYVLNTLVTGKIKFGKTLFNFYNGPTSRWDRANQLWVLMEHGELSSVSEEELLGGKNLCAVKNTSGEWELIQFKTAFLTDTKKYKLTDLLRGQFGSERAMRAPLAPDADFVLLDSAVTQPDMGRSDIGLNYYYLDGPSNRDIGDDSYNSSQYAFRGEGLRPYSVTGLMLTRVGTNLEISWKRRVRIGGDGWEETEIPLLEEYEQYTLVIYNGATAVRTLTLTSSSFNYTSTMYNADFGLMPEWLDVSVTQNTSYGPGPVRRQWINVRRAT